MRYVSNFAVTYLKDNENDCSLWQFSLSLVHGDDTHGLTIDKVVVEIGQNETTAGLLHATFSWMKK